MKTLALAEGVTAYLFEAGGKTKTVRATLAKPGATVPVAMD